MTLNAVPPLPKRLSRPVSGADSQCHLLDVATIRIKKKNVGGTSDDLFSVSPKNEKQKTEINTNMKTKK